MVDRINDRDVSSGREWDDSVAGIGSKARHLVEGSPEKKKLYLGVLGRFGSRPESRK